MVRGRLEFLHGQTILIPLESTDFKLHFPLSLNHSFNKILLHAHHVSGTMLDSGIQKGNKMTKSLSFWSLHFSREGHIG